MAVVAALAVLTGAVHLLQGSNRTAPWFGIQAQDFGSHTSPHRSGPVVVIGAGGLSFDEVSARQTPHLWSMLAQGASATVSVRSVHDNTCPLDGWLSLSAGNRSGQPGSAGAPACQALPAVRLDTGRTPGNPLGWARAQVAGWPLILATAAHRQIQAKPGLLGQELGNAGRCVHAVGSGAALAAATSTGEVAAYQPYSTDEIRHIDLAACSVTIIDVGSVRDADTVDRPDAAHPAGPNGASVARQVRAADARIGQVLARVPTNADVLVFAPCDSGAQPYLRLVSLRGPYVAPGILGSDSTRQRGLVQSADVTATVLAHAELAVPDAVAGTPLQVLPDRNVSTAIAPQAAVARLLQLRDLGDAANQVHPLVAPFFVMWVLLQLIAYGFAWRSWRSAPSGSPTRRRVAAIVARIATAAAAVPAATFLANLLPWWRGPMTFLALTASVAVFTAAICVPAFVGPWARRPVWPVGVVCAATLGVLAVDMMTGSRLQLSSLMGLQPVVGGRFYGMGNVSFALFATAALILAVTLAGPVHRSDPRLAGVLVLLVGGGALLVDIAPMWGADAGGPPALLPGVAYLALVAAGVRLSPGRVVAILVATVGFVAIVCVADWLRPPQSRTHLGRFVQSVIDGDAGDIVSRKLDQNLAFVVSTPLMMIIPIALLVVLYTLLLPRAWPGRLLARSVARVPLLHAGLIALAVTLVIGFVVNDSGAAIPAVSGTMILPILLALGARTCDAGGSRPVAKSAGEPPESADADGDSAARRRSRFQPWQARL